MEDRETVKDLVPILAMDRLGGKASFMGLLKGFGLQREPAGQPWRGIRRICSWQVVMRFHEDRDRKIKEMGGGAVYAIGRRLLQNFLHPLRCHLLKPMEIMREEMAQIETALRKNGVPWDRPVLTLDTLGSSAIPQLRLLIEVMSD